MVLLPSWSTFLALLIATELAMSSVAVDMARIRVFSLQVKFDLINIYSTKCRLHIVKYSCTTKIFKIYLFFPLKIRDMVLN